MLLLTDQREVHADKPLVFNALGKEITFKYNIKSREYYKMSGEPSLQLEIRCDIGEREFILPFPTVRADMIAHIGAWIGHMLRENYMRNNAKDIYKRHKAHHDVQLWSTKDKEIGKLKSKIYLASNRIGSILASWIQQDFLIGSGISKKDWDKVLKINYRIGVGRKHGLMEHLPLFYDIHKYGKQGIFNQVINDLSKYNRALSKYILHRYNVKDDYYTFLKTIPYYAKNCKYGFSMGDAEPDYLEKCHKLYGKPKARFNWFVLNAIIAQKRAIDDDNIYLLKKLNEENENKWNIQRLEENNLRIEFLEKLYHSDRSVWTYFRKHMRIKKNYSTGLIVSMLDTIKDGKIIYQNARMNTYGIKLMPIEGSAMNMVRNALFNHNQDRELSKKQKFDKPNFHLPTPPIKLPDWIEAIRLKTAHDMIAAGIDCNHCIGNYTSSTDIFVREKNICAQIHRYDLSVGQCYDVRDAITKESKNLHNRLTKALASIKPKEIKHDKERVVIGAEGIQW